MQDALQLSTDTDMIDWHIFDRDHKNTVIYQDKLISDALLNQPIKTEHSYSLNSDGDSIPDSPRSLQNKIDGKQWLLLFLLFFSFLFFWMKINQVSHPWNNAASGHFIHTFIHGGILFASQKWMKTMKMCWSNR